MVASGVDYFCLAAGKGTRFGHLGRYLQKCMYPVGLRPFLELSVRNLVNSSEFDSKRDRLILVVGQFQEQVRAYFEDTYEGLKITYVEQPQPLGTGHALHLAYETAKPTEPVVAWLADLYVPSELFEQLQRHPYPNVQTLGPGHVGEKTDLQVSVSGDRVVKAWRGVGDYDVGLWKLSPEVLSLMTAQRHGEYRMMPNLQLALEKGHPIGFVKTDEWLHLGGTQPSPEENVRAVVARVLELEPL